jgi:colanic acid/amylovoran biosynthesis glycosyltransferase
LRAFANFAKAFPKSTFLIAGDGPLRRELEELSQKLDLQKAVIFLGFLSQTELRVLYEKAHIFMHPSELPPDSNQEGVPNSMLEAMASGLPVVATRHGGIPEAVTDGVSGSLVPERDVEGLTASLLRIVENPDRWIAMGAAASDAVAVKFAQPHQIESLESAYSEAIEQWRKGRSDAANAGGQKN